MLRAAAHEAWFNSWEILQFSNYKYNNNRHYFLEHHYYCIFYMI